jgi:hypothetical protein
MVESAGEGVRNVKPSDRAAFTGMPSAYSEAILADADRLIPLPNEFTFQEGAAFPRQLGSEPVFGRALCDLIRRRLVWDCALPSRVSDPVSVSQPAAIRSTGLALKDQRAYRRNFQGESNCVQLIRCRAFQFGAQAAGQIARSHLTCIAHKSLWFITPKANSRPVRTQQQPRQ